MTDLINKIVKEIVETEEEFILTTIKPWCEETIQRTIPKCDLKRALTLYFNIDTEIKTLEKQKAISELQPPTDNWETYANRLYDLAYLSGYNDGLIAKGNLWGNTNE